MTKQFLTLPTFKPQAPEEIKAEHDAGLTAPTEHDRDATVMAERFQKMGLSREQFNAMCEEAAAKARQA